MEGIKIIMDDREPEFMKEVLELLDVKVKKRRLSEGDYLCEGVEGVIVERKTIDDFCSSIIDGRLKEQIESMEFLYPHIYVLISGKLEDRNSNIHIHSILGMLASLVVKGVSVCMVDDDIQVGYIMKRIFERWKEKIEEEKEKRKEVEDDEDDDVEELEEELEDDEGEEE